MRIAVTGAAGLLGRALVENLLARGHNVFAGTHQSRIELSDRLQICKLDLNDEDSIHRFTIESEAECCIHAAAMTHVDRCETEPNTAQAINADATTRLVAAFQSSQSRFIYISTDYVFDGRDGPYFEDDAPRPINVYGQTKLEGERAVLESNARNAVVRTAGILGIGPSDRPTFTESMIAMMRADPPLRAAGDLFANITPVEYLASAIAEIAERGMDGIWHVAGREIVSRFELAQRLARIMESPRTAVEEVKYADLRRPAARPLNGGLRVEKANSQLTVTCPPLDIALINWDTLRNETSDGRSV